MARVETAHQLCLNGDPRLLGRRENRLGKDRGE